MAAAPPSSLAPVRSAPPSAGNRPGARALARPRRVTPAHRAPAPNEAGTHSSLGRKMELGAAGAVPASALWRRRAVPARSPCGDMAPRPLPHLLVLLPAAPHRGQGPRQQSDRFGLSGCYLQPQQVSRREDFSVGYIGIKALQPIKIMRLWKDSKGKMSVVIPTISWAQWPWWVLSNSKYPMVLSPWGARSQLPHHLVSNLAVFLHYSHTRPLLPL